MPSPYIINDTIRLDLSSNEIHHLPSGRTYQLGTNEIELLQFFIQHNGELISRHALLQEIWVAKGVFVEDGSLMQAISVCRKALQDKDGKIIMTERGKGYRFQAEITQAMQAEAPNEAPRAPEGQNVLWLALATLTLSSVMSYWLVSRLTPTPTLLTQLHTASFTRCRVMLEGQMLHDLRQVTQYSFEDLSLLVDSSGRSVSYPTQYQGVLCDE